MRFSPYSLQLQITELNEKGYGVSFQENKEYWILNALPGECVNAEIIARKKGKRFGIAKEIYTSSLSRITEKEEHFLSCSPWQILKKSEEIRIKRNLIKKFFREQSGIELSDFEVSSSGNKFHYRNKLEFSFYGNDDNSVSLAYHKRDGGRAKYFFDECVLAPEIVNEANRKVISWINEKKFQARDFKGILNRFSKQEQKAISALYLRTKDFCFTNKELEDLIDKQLKGVIVIYSEPNSPAFIETEILNQAGDTDVKEKVLDKHFIYPYDGFFQINIPVFEEALKDIRQLIQTSTVLKPTTIIDLYAGVGTIGISIADQVDKVICVELFEKSKKYAEKNIEINRIGNIEFIQDKSENSGVKFLEKADILIVDPPRVGLHPKVIKGVLDLKPKEILYLSCNPKTQAENFRDLKEFYEIKFFKAYNFYPHTPHVESLMKLELK